MEDFVDGYAQAGSGGTINQHGVRLAQHFAQTLDFAFSSSCVVHVEVELAFQRPGSFLHLEQGLVRLFQFAFLRVRRG